MKVGEIPMSWSTFFIQECPTCGRRLQVQIRDLGREVTCAHCSAEFKAKDADAESPAMLDPITELLSRAEDYLHTAADSPRKPR